MPRLLLLVALFVGTPAHADPHVTVEAALGTGMIPRIYNDAGPGEQAVDAHSVAFGAGVFVVPELALGVRYTTATDGAATFLGATAQGWLAPRLWLGAGMGVVGDNADMPGHVHRGRAPGLDLRAGVAIVRTTHAAVNLSLEYAPGFYLADGSGILGILAAAVGVQLM